MNKEQLVARMESIKADMDKVQNGLHMLANQTEQMKVQYHTLNGHLSEVNYQLQELTNEANCQEAECVAE